MRVFVLGTGRCGSSTFYQACRYFCNYTVGHETSSGMSIPRKYPDNHIEIGSTLLFELGWLLEDYPQTAWIHLIRKREDCVRSLASQAEREMRYYGQQWMHDYDNEIPIEDVADTFYRSVNSLIRATLRPEAVMTIAMENAEALWPKFVEYIGAEFWSSLNRNESARTWRRKYNSANARGRDSYEVRSQV